MKRTFIKIIILFLFTATDVSLMSAPGKAQNYQYSLDGKVISSEAYEAITKGQRFLHANNNAEAIMMLKKACELAPDIPDVHNNLGIALAKSGQPDAAIQEFETARSLNPNLDAAWMSLAGMYQSTGQIDKAIETYKTFLTRFPKHRDSTKIASLVQGLEKEQARQKSVSSSDPDLNRSSEAEDYFREVTRDGIMRWS